MLATGVCLLTMLGIAAFSAKSHSRKALMDPDTVRRITRLGERMRREELLPYE